MKLGRKPGSREASAGEGLRLRGPGDHVVRDHEVDGDNPHPEAKQGSLAPGAPKRPSMHPDLSFLARRPP